MRRLPARALFQVHYRLTPNSRCLNNEEKLSLMIFVFFSFGLAKNES
jgi:hypothetical protein